MKIRIVILLLALFPLVLSANDVINQARKLARQEKVDEALRLLHDYEKTHPDDLELHNAIQSIMERHDRKKEEIAEYKKRFEQHPNAFNAYLYINTLDSPSEREKEFREVVQKHPNEVWGYYGLGTALLDQDNLEEAVGEAKDGLGKVKNPSRIHYVLARIYRRMENYSDAALHMREFYKLEPTKENRETMIAYDHLEVVHEKDSHKKFQLARQYFAHYPQDPAESADITELLFVYADNNSTEPPFSEKLNQALKISTEEKPESDDEKQLHTRVLGALYALQAWRETKLDHVAAAEKALATAKQNKGSEMYYYTAVTESMLKKNEDALKDALRAAVDAPVYPESKKFAADLWEKQHHSQNGLEAALHQAREEFLPQLRQLVVSQMVAEKVQPFEMNTFDGKKLTSKDLSGKIVLMNFWAVWCPPCREELPHWNEFYAAHKNDRDLYFAAVGDEPWETMQNYMKNKKLDFPIFRNEKYWEEFKVDGIPTMVIIDPTGTIRFRNSGFEEGMDYAETLQWQIDAVRQKK